MPAAKKTDVNRKETKAQKLARLQAEIDALEKQVNVGRPVKYKSSFAERATDLCMLGLTNEELADRFGVEGPTIGMWIAQIPEFAAAIYAGREGADADIARAMYQSARGYAHEHDEIKVVSMGDNRGSEIQIVPTIKRYPPNDRMATLWMANKQKRRFPNVGALAPNGGGDGTKSPAEIAAAGRAAIRAALATFEEPAAEGDEPPKPKEQQK